MKDRALEIASSHPASSDGKNLLREYLQSRILGLMQEAGAFVPLAFMGGTALRFLYRIPRFSEDLDFTLERKDTSFDFRELVEGIGRGLEREGYTISLRVSDSSTVMKASVGFAGLLAEAGLSPHTDEVFWIKIEIDIDPPIGAGLTVTTIDRFGLLRVQHHDLPSLFADKVAAVLARKYTKGRDLYDLAWYLTHDPPLELNVRLLQNTMMQVAPESTEEVTSDWRAALQRRLENIDWDEARRDLAPFLEQPRDLELISEENFKRWLRAI